MEIVGWSMAEQLKSVLCEEALKMAIRSRWLPMGLIHHSDRGVQYACIDLPQATPPPWHQGLHEPQGELPRQRPYGELLWVSQDRTRAPHPVFYLA